MKKRPPGLAAPLLVAGLLLFGAAGASAADTPSCADCHEQAKAFAGNAHQRALDDSGQRLTGNAVCQSCHGDGTKHMDGGGDKALIKVPRGRDGVSTCLTCHDQPSQDRSHRSGVHAAALPGCLSCHAVHEAKGAPLLSKPPSELCASCHATQATSLTAKPYGHKLRRGGLGCVSCHDPHARAGQQSALKRGRADELPCLGCHTEKRGPYVFEHVGGTAGTCLSCHEPHGSSNPRQLRRARVDQLCLECHSRLAPAALGSQPPAFHNLSLARYQSCTTCHVAIHGSNRSPKLLK